MSIRRSKNSLVKTYSATSSQCAYGGFVFEAGLDSNYDGVLSLSERQSYEIICNGYDGLDGIQAYDSLIESYDAGSTCGDAGGFYLESGRDLDFDGYLDSNEIENTSYICQ